MGKDRLRPTLPPKMELSQHWKWLPYHCAQLRQLVPHYTKVDMVYTIGVLKCRQEIIFIFRIEALATGVGNSDRQCWPATQKFLDINLACAAKMDTEAEWRVKDDLMPSLAYVYESDPFPEEIVDSIGVKYFEQYIVWEHVDHCICVTLVYAVGQYCQCSPQYTI